MRRASRLSQPLLAAAPSRCTCAPATLPIAAGRALFSTTTTRGAREGVRNALWGGDAPGPENVDDPAATQQLKEEQRRRDQEEAQAEIAAWDAKTPKGKAQKKKERFEDDKFVTAPTAETLTTSGYVPAKTIDELEEIGGLDGWWERHSSGASKPYVGFSSRRIADKIEDGAVCEALVRQALVETLVLSQLDKEALKRKWVPGDRNDFNRATAISLEAIDAEGTVPEAQKEAAETIVQMLQDSERAEKKNTRTRRSPYKPKNIISAHEAQVLVQTWDAKWKAISLEDPLLKFALHKRVFQLTGHYIHDAKLAQVKTVGQLISAVVKPPKPTKVFEAIYAQGSLPELPNVKLSHRRITPIDKEKAVGRWKVIQEELEKRDLPVTGHEHLPRPMQRNWIQGKN